MPLTLKRMKKEMQFSYDDALVNKKDITKITSKLKSEIKNFNSAIKEDYTSGRGFVKLPFDKSFISQVTKLAKEKKAFDPSLIIVVGIGGSNLGTLALQEALLDKEYDLTHDNLRVLYADTLDSDSMSETIEIMQGQLKRRNEVLINVITKSGNTTETIANFEVLLGILKEHRSDFEKYIVACCDKGSEFSSFMKTRGFSVLEIPKNVGGRYSVLSSVGLFPLAMLGVDIKSLLKGAADITKSCLNKKVASNPAAISAAIHYYHYKKNKCISNLFLFSSELESIGKWYRQLVAESLGKNGKGFTPIYSVGSTDLHSMLQLYLGGKNDKITSFLNISKRGKKIKVPQLHYDLVSNIEGKDINEILEHISQATKHAFTKNKRPFIDIKISQRNEYSLGQFIQFKMIEIAYIGSLMNINAFDQPNVEDYKKETRKLLKK